MLPQLNLDDRLFQQWISEARKAIQKRYPEWTDENIHDPGITLLELFSWIGEMQQYYLSRITVDNELKFLKMLGTKPFEAVSAVGNIIFSGVTDDGWLPQGMQIYADEIPFETTESIYLFGANMDKIIVRTDTEANDYTSSNRNEGVAFPAFGIHAKKGNRLYIGFDQPLPIGQMIKLFIRLFDDYPVTAGIFNSLTDRFTPSADVVWQYYGRSTTGAPSEDESEVEREAWINAFVVSDETHQLSFSGAVALKMESAMLPLMVYPTNDRPRYWISCVLQEGNYELPPKINQINMNAVSVVQQESISTIIEFNSDGLPNQQIVLDSKLAFFGLLHVQVRHADSYWLEWFVVEGMSDQSDSAQVYVLTKDSSTFHTTITFGDGVHGQIPAKGSYHIRVITYLEEFEAERWIGTSNGLPFQSFSTQRVPILTNSFMLQTSIRETDSEQLRWFDWTRVDNFDNASRYDRQYILDSKLGIIRFGDHEHGLIPEVSLLPNIRIISLQVGLGDRGNVKAHKITKINELPIESLAISATNPVAAIGGTLAESIDEAKNRAMLDIKQQHRAVTDEDYDRLAKMTPGLRVARVKTLTLFKPGLEDYPRKTVPAQTTVVVVPYSEEKTPIPGERFLSNVKQNLDQYRLITTELNVIAPEYIRITVHAVIIVEPYFKKDSPRILSSLNRFLQPLDHGKDLGWVFGRPVYKGDIYGLINQMKGIAYIQDLWLEADGVQKDKNGDILLPPHGLVYSGDHLIECISRTDI
ncbi:MAG: putative baseplate assembly protein [Paenibacillaceae bacterium]